MRASATGFRHRRTDWSAIRTALEAGWQAILPSLLGDWRIMSGIALAALGSLLRWAARLWLRRKLRGGLGAGPTRA